MAYAPNVNMTDSSSADEENAAAAVLPALFILFIYLEK